MAKRRSQTRAKASLDRLSPAPDVADDASGDASDASGGSAVTAATSAVKRAAAAVPSAPEVREQVRAGAGALVENPIGLALGGIAVGFLAGLLIPVTDIEERNLGPVGANIADQVQTHVQAIGQDVVEHGKAVLAETVQAAVVDGKNPVEAAQSSMQDHLGTVAQNAQSRIEESLHSAKS